MSKFVIGAGTENELVYDLFAVSNHYGSMSGGHYTAFGKNPLLQKWFEFDDDSVKQVSPADVVSKSGYVLFYKKRQ